MTNILPEGLFVTPNFITKDEEHELITWLDKQQWSTELSRRTQHYGYRYDYKNRGLGDALPLDGPLLKFQRRLVDIGYPGLIQCIANEYYRDQGIAPHIDRDIFGPIIMGLSLGADAVMLFEHANLTYRCELPRRSLLMLSGPARSEWKHSLSKNVAYIDAQGNKIVKPLDYRRISCTFRSVV